MANKPMVEQSPGSPSSKFPDPQPSAASGALALPLMTAAALGAVTSAGSVRDQGWSNQGGGRRLHARARGVARPAAAARTARTGKTVFARMLFLTQAQPRLGHTRLAMAGIPGRGWSAPRSAPDHPEPCLGRPG